MKKHTLSTLRNLMKFKTIIFLITLTIVILLTGCGSNNNQRSVTGDWISDGFLPISVYGLDQLELEIRDTGDATLTATFIINNKKTIEVQSGKVVGNMLYIKSGSSELIRDGKLLKMVDPVTKETTGFRRK